MWHTPNGTFRIINFLLTQEAPLAPRCSRQLVSLNNSRFSLRLARYGRNKDVLSQEPPASPSDTSLRGLELLHPVADSMPPTPPPSSISPLEVSCVHILRAIASFRSGSGGDGMHSQFLQHMQQRSPPRPRIVLQP